MYNGPGCSRAMLPASPDQTFTVTQDQPKSVEEGGCVGTVLGTADVLRREGLWLLLTASLLVLNGGPILVSTPVISCKVK